MTEPQYTVGTDDLGQFTIVDQSHSPHLYTMAGKRYGTREEAQERADRYNAIKEGTA
jgi:hypothetical protein